MRQRSLLCAALLAAGRPLQRRELARLLELNPDAPDVLGAVVEDLQQTLHSAQLGLCVEEVAGGYQLVVDASLSANLATLLAPPLLPALSQAALETLAIIAYQQPLTRGELEASRGASCASTLDTLQERDLIKTAGRKEVIGRPWLYVTTEKFLLEFGLRSLEDLPPLAQPAQAFVRS